MTTNKNIWTYREEATLRLKTAEDMAGGAKPADLISSKARRPIIKTLSNPKIARDLFGMRQTSMQERWRILVELCADRPWALGFYQVDDALRGLGIDMNADYTTLCRNLSAWESRTPPLVMTGYGERIKANAPLALIHIPLLTQWLLWTAENRARQFGEFPNYLGDELIEGVARLLIPMGLPPPPEYNKAEAQRLVELAKVDPEFYLRQLQRRKRFAALRRERRAKWRRPAPVPV